MSRIPILIVLSVVILLSVGYSVLKFGSLGEPGNWFNRCCRTELAERQFSRRILALNNDGDAKADYFSSQTQDITIEVDTLADVTLVQGVLKQAGEIIAGITEKPVHIVSSSIIPRQAESYALEEARAFESRYRVFRPTRVKAVLYLLVLNREQENPSRLGSTLGADGAVVYADALADYGNTKAEALTTSTVLHEFLHQLGLPHISALNCVMNETVEIGGFFEMIPTELCTEEQALLNQIKASIN